MAQLITLTGFAFTPLESDPTNIQNSTLQLQASDDLEFTTAPVPGATDGSRSLSVAEGEVFGAQLDLLTPNLTSSQWSARFVEVTLEGATSELLILDSSDIVRTFVFEIGGDPLDVSTPPSVDQINALFADGVQSDIDSGPFAPGLAFDPGDLSSAEVDPDPFAGTSGPDTIVGFSSNDVIDGEGGDDNISGLFGNDTILGGTGNDFITGDGGNDDINSGPAEGEFGGDNVNPGGGLDIIRGTPADFNLDTISGLDFGDQIIIEGVSPDNVVQGPGFNEYLIETTGDDTPEATFTASQAFGSETAGLVGVADGGDTILQLDPELAPQPGVGTGISGPDDFPTVGDFLFSEGSGVVPIDIYYVGALESIALLDDGFAISEISGDTPNEVVSIDRGVFLSSGGAPRDESLTSGFNTASNFTVGLAEPGDPRLTTTAQDAFPGAGDTNDASLITFTFDAENLGEQSTISFDLFFGSDEFPEFVNSSFVDIAAVYVNGVNYALFNNDVEQPLAIVGESINTPGNFYANDGDDGTDEDPFTGTFDTEYDGFSVLLNVLAPVQPGINTVTIGVADTGDSAFDSGLFVGNIQGSDFDVGGSFVQTPGTSGNDLIDANGAPQLITLGGGEDTVTGTSQELDGDVINGFGNDDTLGVEGAEFGLEDLTVTMGSAILDIDTDGDGEDDTNVVLEGDFEDAVFAVETVDGTTNITASGVNTGDEPEGVELQGTDDGDTLVGTAGDDTIVGGAGDDELDGAAGDDGIFGQDDNDILQGGEGDDEIAGGGGADTIDGEGGNDNIGGGTGNDEIVGGLGNDTIGAGQGDDTASGGDGDDIVNGGGGDDSLVGNDGNDTMGASFNNDEVIGGLGDDDMGGGLGQDTIIGGGGNDRAGGGEGDDSINGGGGDDFLAGGGRDDVINGGVGNDTINAGDGDDTISGGAGEDVFVFLRFNETDADIITDFEDGFDSFVMNDVENAPGTGLQGRLDALNITDVAGGAQITYQGHTVLIEGATAAQLTLDDFDFV